MNDDKENFANRVADQTNHSRLPSPSTEKDDVYPSEYAETKTKFSPSTELHTDDYSAMKIIKVPENSTTTEQCSTNHDTREQAATVEPSFSDNKDLHGSEYGVGDLVTVMARHWVGINKKGGAARVVKVHPPDEEYEDYTYDVSFNVEGGRESRVDRIYLRPYQPESESSARRRQKIKGRCKFCASFVQDCHHDQGLTEEEFAAIMTFSSRRARQHAYRDTSNDLPDGADGLFVNCHSHVQRTIHRRTRREFKRRMRRIYDLTTEDDDNNNNNKNRTDATASNANLRNDSTVINTDAFSEARDSDSDSDISDVQDSPTPHRGNRPTIDNAIGLHVEVIDLQRVDDDPVFSNERNRAALNPEQAAAQVSRRILRYSFRAYNGSQQLATQTHYSGVERDSDSDDASSPVSGPLDLEAPEAALQRIVSGLDCQLTLLALMRRCEALVERTLLDCQALLQSCTDLRRRMHDEKFVDAQYAKLCLEGGNDSGVGAADLLKPPKNSLGLKLAETILSYEDRNLLLAYTIVYAGFDCFNAAEEQLKRLIRLEKRALQTGASQSRRRLLSRQQRDLVETLSLQLVGTLDLQAKELRGSTQQQLDALHDRFAAKYDCSPVDYISASSGRAETSEAAQRATMEASDEYFDDFDARNSLRAVAPTNPGARRPKRVHDSTDGASTRVTAWQRKSVGSEDSSGDEFVPLNRRSDGGDASRSGSGQIDMTRRRTEDSTIATVTDQPLLEAATDFSSEEQHCPFYIRRHATPATSSSSYHIDALKLEKKKRLYQARARSFIVLSGSGSRTVGHSTDALDTSCADQGALIDHHLFDHSGNKVDAVAGQSKPIAATQAYRTGHRDQHVRPPNLHFPETTDDSWYDAGSGGSGVAITQDRHDQQKAAPERSGLNLDISVNQSSQSPSTMKDQQTVRELVAHVATALVTVTFVDLQTRATRGSDTLRTFAAQFVSDTAYDCASNEDAARATAAEVLQSVKAVVCELCRWSKRLSPARTSADMPARQKRQRVPDNDARTLRVHRMLFSLHELLLLGRDQDADRFALLLRELQDLARMLVRCTGLRCCQPSESVPTADAVSLEVVSVARLPPKVVRDMVNLVHLEAMHCLSVVTSAASGTAADELRHCTKVLAAFDFMCNAVFVPTLLQLFQHRGLLLQLLSVLNAAVADQAFDGALDVLRAVLVCDVVTANTRDFEPCADEDAARPDVCCLLQLLATAVYALTSVQTRVCEMLGSKMIFMDYVRCSAVLHSVKIFGVWSCVNWATSSFAEAPDLAAESLANSWNYPISQSVESADIYQDTAGHKRSRTTTKPNSGPAVLGKAMHRSTTAAVGAHKFAIESQSVVCFEFLRGVTGLLSCILQSVRIRQLATASDGVRIASSALRVQNNWSLLRSLVDNLCRQDRGVDTAESSVLALMQLVSQLAGVWDNGGDCLDMFFDLLAALASRLGALPVMATRQNTETIRASALSDASVLAYSLDAYHHSDANDRAIDVFDAIVACVNSQGALQTNPIDVDALNASRSALHGQMLAVMHSFFDAHGVLNPYSEATGPQPTPDSTGAALQLLRTVVRCYRDLLNNLICDACVHFPDELSALSASSSSTTIIVNVVNNTALKRLQNYLRNDLKRLERSRLFLLHQTNPSFLSGVLLCVLVKETSLFVGHDFLFAPKPGDGVPAGCGPHSSGLGLQKELLRLISSTSIAGSSSDESRTEQLFACLMWFVHTITFNALPILPLCKNKPQDNQQGQDPSSALSRLLHNSGSQTDLASLAPTTDVLAAVMLFCRRDLGSPDKQLKPATQTILAAALQAVSTLLKHMPLCVRYAVENVRGENQVHFNRYFPSMLPSELFRIALSLSVVCLNRDNLAHGQSDATNGLTMSAVLVCAAVLSQLSQWLKHFYINMLSLVGGATADLALAPACVGLFTEFDALLQFILSEVLAALRKLYVSLADFGDDDEASGNLCFDAARDCSDREFLRDTLHFLGQQTGSDKLRQYFVRSRVPFCNRVLVSTMSNICVLTNFRLQLQGKLSAMLPREPFFSQDLSVPLRSPAIAVTDQMLAAYDQDYRCYSQISSVLFWAPTLNSIAKGFQTVSNLQSLLREEGCVPSDADDRLLQAQVVESKFSLAVHLRLVDGQLPKLYTTFLANAMAMTATRAVLEEIEFTLFFGHLKMLSAHLFRMWTAVPDTHGTTSSSRIRTVMRQALPSSQLWSDRLQPNLTTAKTVRLALALLSSTAVGEGTVSNDELASEAVVGKFLTNLLTCDTAHWNVAVMQQCLRQAHATPASLESSSMAVLRGAAEANKAVNSEIGQLIGRVTRFLKHYEDRTGHSVRGTWMYQFLQCANCACPRNRLVDGLGAEGFTRIDWSEALRQQHANFTCSNVARLSETEVKLLLGSVVVVDCEKVSAALLKLMEFVQSTGGTEEKLLLCGVRGLERLAKSYGGLDVVTAQLEQIDGAVTRFRMSMQRLPVTDFIDFVSRIAFARHPNWTVMLDMLFYGLALLQCQSRLLVAQSDLRKLVRKFDTDERRSCLERVQQFATATRRSCELLSSVYSDCSSELFCAFAFALNGRAEEIRQQFASIPSHWRLHHALSATDLADSSWLRAVVEKGTRLGGFSQASVTALRSQLAALLWQQLQCLAYERHCELNGVSSVPVTQTDANAPRMETPHDTLPIALQTIKMSSFSSAGRHMLLSSFGAFLLLLDGHSAGNWSESSDRVCNARRASTDRAAADDLRTAIVVEAKQLLTCSVSLVDALLVRCMQCNAFRVLADKVTQDTEQNLSAATVQDQDSSFSTMALPAAVALKTHSDTAPFFACAWLYALQVLSECVVLKEGSQTALQRFECDRLVQRFYVASTTLLDNLGAVLKRLGDDSHERSMLENCMQLHKTFCRNLVEVILTCVGECAAYDQVFLESRVDELQETLFASLRALYLLHCCPLREKFDDWRRDNLPLASIGNCGACCLCKSELASSSVVAAVKRHLLVTRDVCMELRTAARERVMNLHQFDEDAVEAKQNRDLLARVKLAVSSNATHMLKKLLESM